MMLGYSIDKVYTIDFLEREHNFVSKGFMSFSIAILCILALISIYVVYKIVKRKSAIPLLFSLYLLIPAAAIMNLELMADERVFFDDTGKLIDEIKQKGYREVVFTKSGVTGVR